MILVRLIPIILSTLLFAAHLSRNYNDLPALLVILLLAVLFIRKSWVIRFYQAFLSIAAIFWIKITIQLVTYRLSEELPYIRLSIILIILILFTLWSAIWMNSKKIKDHYSGTNHFTK